MKEIWKELVGYPNYKISNMGHVKSLRRDGTYKDVSFFKNQYGYLTFGPSKNGKRRTAFVHVEVAKAFLENPNNYEDVHHIDYNKDNCCVDNLMWMSHTDNMKDYFCTIKNPKYVKDNDGNYIKIKKDYGICVDCGKLISSRSTRCRDCSAKEIPRRYKNSKPLEKREVVECLIKNKGNFTKASKRFNMTDNGLRKWCKKYDLPTHSKEWKN